MKLMLRAKNIIITIKEKFITDEKYIKKYMKIVKRRVFKNLVKLM